MNCKACKDTPKDWNGSDRKCAFIESSFGKNWNCATVNLIREICGDIDNLPDGVSYQYCDDQKYATIKVDHINGVGSALALWVTWYKSRGATDAMWLLFEKHPPRKPTESELLNISNAYK